MNRLIDLHSHLIPSVDDGARTVEEARAALQAMVAAGVGHIVTTPHFDASLQNDAETGAARLGELDRGWEILENLARSEFPELDLGRGVELRLDIPEPNVDEPRLRLAGGDTILVEFPYMTVPPGSERVLARLRATGAIPLLAHPERYNGMDDGLDLPSRWRRSGGYLQVNLGSFLGQYGAGAAARARALLTAGLIDCLASDYHARKHPPIQAARELLLEWVGEEHADLLMRTNPERLIRGQAPLPAPPVKIRSGAWAKLRALFGRGG